MRWLTTASTTPATSTSATSISPKPSSREENGSSFFGKPKSHQSGSLARRATAIGTSSHQSQRTTRR